MGQRSRGSPKTHYFRDVEEKISCTSYPQLKETTKDRNLWLLRQGVDFRT